MTPSCASCARRSASAVSVRQERYRTEEVAGPAHRALARQAAEQSAVLLKNDLLDGKPLLPLDPLARKIAVLGRLADTPNTGDGGSSMVRPPQVITPLQGLRQRFPAWKLITMMAVT